MYLSSWLSWSKTLIAPEKEGGWRGVIRESVDSLYRDGADTQYIQYLSKSHETQPQACFKLKEVPK